MAKYDVSVVVPSVNSFSDLKGCLTALHNQTDAKLEIIVVDRLGFALVVNVQNEFPDVVILSVPPGTTIPQMRALAIRAATAPAIAVIEDHVIAPPGWARQMLDALDDGNDVVAGSVENAATETLTDWAAFLCEYSAALPPLPSGPAEGLPGNNTIYRRALLEKYDHVLDDGKWENHLHDIMRGDGVILMQRPEIVVGHKMHYSFGLYMSQRFLYSRSYAGARTTDTPLPKRILMGFAAFALPPMMFIRTIQRIVSKRKHLGYLAKSIPMLVAFCTSWGAGEVVGYWFGAGNSLSKVR